MLIINNVTKKYSSNEVLKNISLNLPDVGLVTILGESGSGKSTLLNLIGLLDKPSSGNIYYDKYNYKKISKSNINKLHKDNIGFIYQNYNLINYMNVKDNIMLTRKYKEIDKLLEYLGISSLKKKKVSMLSGGEKQRVAIARALVNDPDIILADEPTGALDKKNSKIIMKLLKELSSSKLVIMVSHNRSLAYEYSDRVITISDGKVVSDEILNDNKMLDKYSKNKNRIHISRLINLSFSNFINKYKRNIITILAISIGLISLSLVLGISNGFKRSMDYEEKNSLSKYPLYISKTSVDLDNELSSIFKQNKNDVDKINVINSDHKNKITKDYVNNLEVINNNISNKVFTYIYDNRIITTSINKLSDIEILYGKYPSLNNEVILLLDYNNEISDLYLKNIYLNEKSYNYSDVVGYSFKLNNKKYIITGVARSLEGSVTQDLSGLIYLNNNFSKLVPESIYLYPKSYNDKIVIKKHLNSYKNITYSDYSSSIKSISETLMKGISVVLSVFSFISLIVSTIMIGILSYINILERIKEIGLLKSMGVSNLLIKFVFYFESIIIGLSSSLLSTGVLYLTSIPINSILFDLTGMNNILLVNKNIIFVSMFISVLLCTLGSALPIRRCKRLSIVDALKCEE